VLPPGFHGVPPYSQNLGVFILSHALELFHRSGTGYGHSARSTRPSCIPSSRISGHSPAGAPCPRPARSPWVQHGMMLFTVLSRSRSASSARIRCNMPGMHLDTDTWHTVKCILRDGTTRKGFVRDATHPHLPGYFFFASDLA
jgi:hypothetical protein